MERQISEGTFEIVYKGVPREQSRDQATEGGHGERRGDDGVHEGGRHAGQVPALQHCSLLHRVNDTREDDARDDGDGVCAVRVADGLHQEAGRSNGEGQDEADARRCEGPCLLTR